MLTQQDLEWHRRYEALPEDDRDAIDAAFIAAQDALVGNGFVYAATDDRAEALVAAIARYVVESQR